MSRMDFVAAHLDLSLARDGGTPARTRPEHPMFPGGMELGAGDAFAAALGHGLLQDLPLIECVRRGTVAGALVASRLACSAAMPRLEELEEALA